MENDTLTDIDEFKEELFDFLKAKIRINEMIDSWKSNCDKAIERRKERYIDLNIEDLRQSGEIQEDETFIPDRVIDTNIMRELPEYLAFIKQSNRLAIFNNVSNPSLDNQQIEREFTKGLTYEGWYCQFLRCVDGAALHGQDAIEVVFDETKPFHVSFEHVGYDRLFYNKKVSNIQDSEFLIRKYEITVMRLEAFKNKGFDVEQIDAIIEKNKAKRKKDDIEVIYKVYFKYQGVVYITWYSRDSNINDWLKKPEILQIGIADEIVDLYPIFLCIYRDDEQETIVDHKGRGFLDAPQQEAHTAIISGFVNGLIRASNVYASPATDDGESADIKQLDVQLVHGGIYSKPLNFFHTDYPDVTVLSAMQFLGTLNAQQTGKTSYAVSNRKDARKTAKELSIAETEERQLESVNLSNFSEYMRSILSFTWRIVQSQAIQGKIPFLLIPQPIMIPGPNGQMIDSGQIDYVNNIDVISEVYEIRPAGDVDVIERQNKLFQMKQDWAVVQNTALKDRFLEDLIKLSYPDRADEYTRILREGNPGKKLVQALSELVKGFTSPEELAGLSDEEKLNLQQIKEQVDAYLATP